MEQHVYHLHTRIARMLLLSQTRVNLGPSPWAIFSPSSGEQPPLQLFLGGFPWLQAAAGPTLGLPHAVCRAKVWDGTAPSRLSQTQPLPEATSPAHGTPGLQSSAEEPR